MKPIIKVENLSKQYKLGVKQAANLTFRESIMESVRAPFDKLRRNGENGGNEPKGSFWALRDVNFEVMPGDVIGIIGRNGAGKSTLLKILSRITEPTAGKIDLYGRIASLLEVGTGFHPELSGRENIFLNGAILGMRHDEIAKKLDEIIDFAEIEKFIDTPVKHYSSGMYVRLAFAVAAHLEPEILVVDEVLAVGDSEFQKKCLGKMDEVSKGGRTVLFVSHQMGTIAQLCQKAILLEKGRVLMHGKTDEVIEAYLNQQHINSAYHYNADRVVGKSSYIVSQKLVDENGRDVSEITSNTPIILETKIRVENFNNSLELSLSLQSKTKGRIFTVDFRLQDLMKSSEKEKVVRLIVPANIIAPSSYSWLSSIHLPGSMLIDVLWDECNFKIADVGTEFARYEGVDYGCIMLKDYSVEVFDN